MTERTDTTEATDLMARVAALNIPRVDRDRAMAALARSEDILDVAQSAMRGLRRLIGRARTRTRGSAAALKSPPADAGTARAA